MEWTYELTGDAIGVVLDGALASAFLTLVDESDEAEEIVIAAAPAKKAPAKKAAAKPAAKKAPAKKK